VAGAEEGVNCTQDQSVLATICRNWRKGGISCLAPHHEPVVDEMVTVILRPVVWPQEDLEAMTHGLNGVDVVPCVWIDEV
jgi:hypothetical protein